MDAAIRAAHNAVCGLPFDRQSSVDWPATTIVAAWFESDFVKLGWLGDSRAYMLAGPGARLLTRNHSWMALVTERGDRPKAQAWRAAAGTTTSPC